MAKQAGNKKEESVKQTAWEAWLQRLPADVRARLDNQDGQRVAPPVLPNAYDVWLSGLPEEVARKLSSTRDVSAPTVEEEKDVMRWGLFESHSGDYPVCRTFATPEELVRYMGSLETQDVAVRPFWGLPLRFTAGPQRYLFLPDGVTALQIPLYAGGPCKRVDADLLANLVWQDDGFLGHPSLLESVTDLTEQAGDAEDDDDEEDSEEAGV